MATLTYLEGNSTVVWIFRSRYKNFFWLASLLSALPAHLVCAHTGGGRSHPSNLPRVLVHPEVCRGKGARGEAACQRGGRGLGLAAKGCGKVLHLVKRTQFSLYCPWSPTRTPYFSPVPAMSGNLEKLKVVLSPATKYSAEYESEGASIVSRYLGSSQ